MKKDYLYLIIILAILIIGAILVYFIVNKNQPTKHIVYLTSQELCGDVSGNDPSALSCWDGYAYEEGKSRLCFEPCAKRCQSLNFKASSSIFGCYSYEEVNGQKSDKGYTCTRSCKCECI